MCLRPIIMYDLGINPKTGKRKLSAKRPSTCALYDYPQIPVPCGKCPACLQSRAQGWIRRLQLEHISSCSDTFITLTYDSEHLPLSPSRRDIQCFLKRLRHAARDYGVIDSSVRYFIVSERGTEKGRIHYHGVIFGFDMMTDPAWCTYLHHFHDGYPVYTSPVLEKIWSNGFVSVDSVTDDSIAYIAKYILFDLSKDNIRLFSRSLGLPFFFYHDSLSNDLHLFPSALNSVYNGFITLGSFASPYKVILPKFLDRHLEKCRPDLLELVKARRKYFALHSVPCVSPSRLEHYLLNERMASKQKRKLDHES